MLNKLCTSLCLLCFVFIACAQEPEDKKDEAAQKTKRPSWSAGLPERQKNTDLTKPEFKPEFDNKIELDMSEFGLQKEADIEIDLPIKSDIAGMPLSESEASELDTQTTSNTNLEPAAAVVSESESVIEPVVEQPVVEQVAELPVVEQPAVEQPAVEQVAESPLDEQLANEADELPVTSNPSDELAELEQTAVADQQPEDVAETVISEAIDTDDNIADEEARASTNSDDSDEASLLVEPETIAIPEERSIASVEPPVRDLTTAINDVASEKAEYNWNILKRAPVDYPKKAAIDNLEGWVEVEITINTSGEVVSASPIKYSRRGRVFGKPAVDSVSDWLFEPPSNMGISTNLTRVYKIEFNL